jgi:hypothetical protein
VLKIIKAGGTCVAAVALALAIAPAAGAATTSTAAPVHSSVAAAADHHQPRGQHGHRLAEGGGGWDQESTDHWDGGWDGPNGSGADWGTDFSSGEDHMSDWGHYRDNPGHGRG